MFKKSKLIRIIKNILWKYGVGRTHDELYIREINDRALVSARCPGLYSYLRKVHPRPWYDDEMDALFFAVYDYMIYNGMCVKMMYNEYDYFSRVKINGNYYKYASVNRRKESKERVGILLDYLLFRSI